MIPNGRASPTGAAAAVWSTPEHPAAPPRTSCPDVGGGLLDGEPCHCSDYPNRTARVKDCVRLTPRNINRIVWLPPTCAYRLLADGRDLYWLHPLVSGDPETVHAAGISVRGRVGACEDDVE